MPIFVRSASAKWSGTGKEGSGRVTGESKALDIPYNWNNRFGDGTGTNPEEILAAAHASCFTMKVAFVLNSMGLTADELNTTAHLTTDKAPGDWTVTQVNLVITGKVPGATDTQFKEAVENARVNCPISRAIKAEITAEATLV